MVESIRFGARHRSKGPFVDEILTRASQTAASPHPAHWKVVNDSRSALLACLLALGLCVGFQSWLYLIGNGELVGPDSYLRLVRIAELSATWGWYDDTIARINAPHGMSLHWTRPFDLVLLVGAATLTPIMGFDKALYWSAQWVSPLLHIFVLIGLYWATAPLLDPWRRFLVLVAGMGQVAVIVYAVPGRADHHMLILLAFVLTLGLTLRMLLRPHDTKLALGAGALLGFGLWVSTEFLLTLFFTLGALGLSWLRHGTTARRNQWHTLGLGLVVLVALLAERPPGAYLSEEFDRISVVHLFVASLAFGLWTVVLAIERKRPVCESLAVRSAILGIGGLLAAGLLFAVYPKFFGGPSVDMDPRLAPILLDDIGELQPLLPTDGKSLTQFLTFLGPTLVAIPFLVFLLWDERRGAVWEGWLYLGLMTLLFLPLALALLRFAPYVGILIAIPLAELVGRLMKPLNRLVSLAPVRFALRFGLVGLFVLGFAVASSAMNLAGPKEPRPDCGLSGISTLLNDPEGLGDRSRIILAHMDRGSELLYRTRHAVIAATYHRNTQGLLDADRIFKAEDRSVSHRMLSQRGASLILLCADENAPEFKFFDEQSFMGRLLRGDVPDWLRKLDTPTDAAGRFLLFEVVR